MAKFILDMKIEKTWAWLSSAIPKANMIISTKAQETNDAENAFDQLVRFKKRKHNACNVITRA